jgi:hypothetical protein
LAISRSYNVTVNNNEWVDSGDAENQLGYGAQVGTSTGVHFYDNNSRNTRHGIDFISGDAPSNNCSVTGGVLIGIHHYGSPLSTHAGANHITFSDVTVVGGDNGVTIRSPNTIVQNVTIVQPTQTGIEIYGGTGAQIITHSMSLDAYAGYVPPTSFGGTFLQLREPDGSVIFDVNPNATDALIVRGNVATSTENFIESLDSTNGAWRRVTIEDNVANLENPNENVKTEFIDFQDDAMTLFDTVIRNNTAYDVSGSFEAYRTADPTLTWGDAVIHGNLGALASGN